MEINERYINLNNSYRRKMVFNLGVEAGFYSEYNNMILCMLFCLQNNISFHLFSAKANFRIDKGWTDYFLPFCPEDNNRYHARYNFRRPGVRGNPFSTGVKGSFYGAINFLKNNLDPLRKRLIKMFIFKAWPGRYYFTYELWNNFHSGDFQRQHFYIPELGIDGNLQHACSVLVKLSLRFNPVTLNQIEKLEAEITLPRAYIGMHIRRGDKFLEFPYQDLPEYFRKAENLSQLREAFILTDDYQVIREICSLFPNWRVYTLCSAEQEGYDHKAFQKENMAVKNEKQLKLFASLEILYKSDLFIGTFTSNPGMFLGMRLPKNRCFGVDVDSWFIV